MINLTKEKSTEDTTVPLWLHTGAAVATIFCFGWIKARLDASYAASKHPVGYATAQLAFDGETTKGYYAQMLEKGTLDIYRTTQFMDFGLILAMICIGIFVCTLIDRASRAGSLGRLTGLIACGCVIAASVSDATENGLSFIMLANPTNFDNWLAIAYSAFASIKFSFLALAMLSLIASVALAIFGRLTRKPRMG